MCVLMECTNSARVLSKELAGCSDKTAVIYYFPQTEELHFFKKTFRMSVECYRFLNCKEEESVKLIGNRQHCA